MNLVQASVRDLGTGLVVIGGTESYGPGGCVGTALAARLPVQIQMPQDMQKPPVAVVLVLESTESGTGDQVLRGAAEAVVEQLTPRDFVGVTDGGAGMVVPLAPLTDKAAIKRKIEAMILGDPFSYAPDLSAADQALTKTTAAIKHVILFGDCATVDRNYQPPIPALHGPATTLSPVPIAPNTAHPSLLQAI